MSMQNITWLPRVWERAAEEATSSSDYGGKVHRAYEAIQARICGHIPTDDMRLFGLLHLLGQALLRMEQTLWLEDFERITRDAVDPNAKFITTDEVMQVMQERIDQARNKPC